MKLRYITGYAESQGLDRETALELIAAMLIVLGVVTTGPIRIGLIIGSITLLITIRVANRIEDVAYISKYRVPKQVKGENRMSQTTTDRKLQKMKAEIQNFPRIIQNINEKIAKLDREARKIRSERLAGIVFKHGDIKKILTKERRLRVVIDEIRSLRKQENADYHKQDREKSDLLLAERFYKLAMHGDEGASKQVNTLIAHY